MSKTKKIILALVLVFAAMQVVVMKKAVPETDPTLEYTQSEMVPADIAKMIKTSCYDCHSYETHYPWYSNVAPVSWLLSSHIKGAREHLNFSLWGEYSAERKTAMKEEIQEELKENGMPLKSYLLMHPEARLSEKEREALIKWFSLQADVLGHRPSELLSKP